MDALSLARWQFGITTVYHFFFVPLTLGLVWVVAVLADAPGTSPGMRPGQRLTKFWGKLFLINFAMGVVTGIVQEFQFGMNWSEYSPLRRRHLRRPARDRGAARVLPRVDLPRPVDLRLGQAAEARAPRRRSGWWRSAPTSRRIWILVANSFMQQPVGYVLRNGRAEMDELLARSSATRTCSCSSRTSIAGGDDHGRRFFVLGISAWHLRARDDDEDARGFRRSFRLGAVVRPRRDGRGHASSGTRRRSTWCACSR